MGPSTGEDCYENIFSMGLAYLLATVFGMREYLGWYRWEFATPQELGACLQEVMDLLVQYGIPWLEDPNSKNSQPLALPLSG